jgi:hypothetical protein
MTDQLLHVVARIAIRFWPPLRAKRCVDAIGAVLRPIDFQEASDLALRLRGGSCLSRSLVIASRMPGAEVVIGTTPRHGTFSFAHAWVEAAGKAIGLDEPKTELARLK